jgi:hypothetical protein
MALGIAAAEQGLLTREFSGRFSVGCSSTKVTELLGPPDGAKPRALQYDLAARSGYVLEFALSEDGQMVLDYGYTPVVRRSLCIQVPHSEEEARTLGALLVKLGVSKQELREHLGEPKNEYGWWPFETWEYGEWLSVELRLGVADTWSVGTQMEGLK